MSTDPNPEQDAPPHPDDVGARASGHGPDTTAPAAPRRRIPASESRIKDRKRFMRGGLGGLLPRRRRTLRTPHPGRPLVAWLKPAGTSRHELIAASRTTLVGTGDFAVRAVALAHGYRETELGTVMVSDRGDHLQLWQVGGQRLYLADGSALKDRVDVPIVTGEPRATEALRGAELATELERLLRWTA